MNPPSILYVLLFVLGLTAPTVGSAVTVGEIIPEFQLESSKQELLHIRDFRGKPVFVNFWASWCAPCRKELPLLSELQNKFEGLVVLAINIDSERNNALQFLGEYPFDGVVMFDQHGAVVDKFKARAMPTSYLIDSDGKIRFVHYGFRQDEDPKKWEEEVRLLLKEV